MGRLKETAGQTLDKIAPTPVEKAYLVMGGCDMVRAALEHGPLAPEVAAEALGVAAGFGLVKGVKVAVGMCRGKGETDSKK